MMRLWPLEKWEENRALSLCHVKIQQEDSKLGKKYSSSAGTYILGLSTFRTLRNKYLSSKAIIFLKYPELTKTIIQGSRIHCESEIHKHVNTERQVY